MSFWCALCLLSTASVLAATPASEVAKPLAPPLASNLIVDQVGLLTEPERSAVAARLAGIAASGRAQIGILISPSTGGEPLASYALRVVEAWRLGSRPQDNGLLVLIVPSQSAARLEVGYGLEGDLPDARAAQLVRAYLHDVTERGASAALNALLDRIELALPPGSAAPRALTAFVERHDEWKIPILLVVLSLFTLLPLLFVSVFGALGATAPDGRRGRAWPSTGTAVAALISAFLLALALGFAARIFWNSPGIGYLVAAIAFLLPLLWSLNTCDVERMGPMANFARIVGAAGLFAYLSTLLTIVVGAAMYVEQFREIWVAPLAGGLFGAGALALVLGGRAGRVMMQAVGYYMYFLLALAIIYVALSGVLRNPLPTSLIVAALVAVLIAIGLTLDSRKRTSQRGRRSRSSAWVFTAAALLFLLPFMILALAHLLIGDEFSTRFAMLLAGDGGFSQFVWWASGALGGSALLVGLGGRFGGGGAGN